MGDANGVQASTLPQPRLTVIEDHIIQLEPLSRRGTGPGLIIITPATSTPEEDVTIKNGVPSPLIKWAEESYTVVQIQAPALQNHTNAIIKAIEGLESSHSLEGKGKYGLIVYDAATFQRLEPQISTIPSIVGVVIYSDATNGLIETKLPSVQHLAGKTDLKLPRSQHLTAYTYPTSKPDFALPSSNTFSYAQEAVSHTRNLTFLKHHSILNAPLFDLEAIWEEHTYFEFAVRDVEKTMATMVQEPYVNHVPTMTGGIGRDRLTHFYTHNFIFSNPDDAALELISRTTGVDRVVDEFIFHLTHDRVVDWVLPGVPPTGKKVEIPMMAVVNVRGDRLYHEHIHWDQATVLRQIGLLPEDLAWPTALGVPDGKLIEGGSAEGSLQSKIPVAGVEAARKLRDKNAEESNLMFGYKLSHIS